jgi:hypothetical protein
MKNFYITLLALLFLVFASIYSYSNAVVNEIDRASFESLRESAAKTEQAIDKIQKGLQKAKKALKTNNKMSKEQKKQLKSQIAEAEAALEKYKAPVSGFNKYADKAMSAIEVYDEITEIKEQYNRDRNLQGPLAAQLRLISKTMSDYGSNVPLLGDAIEMYGTVTTGLLDNTEKIALTLDENFNQGAISGQGYRPAGESREKYEALLRQYPELAKNLTYIPVSPGFIYQTDVNEVDNPSLIWDETEKQFYKIDKNVPVKGLYKMRLLAGRRTQPHELKIVAEKWNDVGSKLLLKSIEIKVIYDTIKESEGYSSTKKAFYEVYNDNYNVLYRAIKDPDLFYSLYLFDSQFRNTVDATLGQLYNKLAVIPEAQKDAEYILEFARKRGIFIPAVSQSDQQVSKPRRIEDTTQSRPPQRIKQKNNTRKTASTRGDQSTQSFTQSKTATNAGNSSINPQLEGQKICNNYMKALVMDVKKLESPDLSRWVEFTRSFTYEDGNCVGAFITWEKKPGKEAHRAFTFYSADSPAKLPAAQLKAGWSKKYPDLGW